MVSHAILALCIIVMGIENNRGRGVPDRLQGRGSRQTSAVPRVMKR